MSNAFQDWVAAFGGTRKVSLALGVSVHAVRHWTQRKGCPRWPTIDAIVKLADGALTTGLIVECTKPRPPLKNPRKLKRGEK